MTQRRGRPAAGASASRGGYSSRLRTGNYGSQQGGGTLSRATMMSTLRAGSQQPSSAMTMRPGIRGGSRDLPSAFAGRNSAGIGSVRGLGSRLQSRSGTPNTGLRAGGSTAQSRFEQMRQQAQQAGLRANQAGQREVAAGLGNAGGNLSINWQARTGARYQVQGSNDRVAWQNKGSIQTGGAGQRSASIDRSFRYYRVVETN